MAVLWTLLIFVGCFTPGKDLPEVDIRFFDKWVHFVLFGGFTFLWLCGYPAARFKRYLTIFLAGVALGILIEILQGIFSSLGRTCDPWDAVADGIGAALGVGCFAIAASVTSGGRTGAK